MEFDGNDRLENSAQDDFDYDSLSFETWVMPSTTTQGGMQLFELMFGQIEVRLATTYQLWVYIEGIQYITGNLALTPDEWNHVLVTYDRNSGELVSYVNGQLDATASGVPAVSWATNETPRFQIGSRFIGAMDYAALYNYALSEDEVAELFSNSLTFYATFDQECGSYYDEISYKDINCTQDIGSNNIIDAPFSDYGIVGTSLGLNSVNYMDNYNPFGDHGYVEVDGAVPLAGNDGAFTIGMWLKKTGDGGNSWEYHLFDLDVAGGDDFTAYANWSTNLKLSLGDCDTNFTLSESDYLPDWRWHHLAFTYDGSGILRIYSDGEEVTAKTCSGLPDLETVNVVHLGGTDANDNSNRAFRGQVDELRFYSKALTAEQMAVLYEESARALHLTFDEPPGQTTFEDNSPNSFEGTCVGTDCPDSGLPGRNNQAIDMLENKITLETADTVGLTENNFTVMAWVKAEAFGGATRTVLGTESAQALQGLVLGVKAAKPYMSFWGTGNDLTGSTTLNEGEWIHLAWRYEYESAGSEVEEMTLFVNGVEEATTTGRAAFVGTDTVYVGKSYGDSYFHGMIDDLVIVKEALEASEIQEIMAEAPLVNLHLDEDLNTTSFTDDSPGQYNVTCSGTACPTAGSKGQMREAPLFDGDDSLSLPTISNLYGNRVSIGMWVKPTKIKNSTQYLIRNGNNFGLSLAANGTGLEYYIKYGFGTCGTRVDYDVNTELIEDQWNHIFFTSEYDFTDGTLYTFYLNGSKTNTLNPTHLACGTPTPATIGENFEGSLDEITIYDTVLNSEEVRAIYDYQSAWYDVVEQHLITIDADDPLVSLELPAYLPDEPTWLTIFAVDPGSQVEQVQVTVTLPGGSETGWASRSETGQGGNGAWLYQFTPGTAGQYTVAAEATDSVGHTGSASQTFYVDDALPSATLDNSLTATIFKTTASVTGSSRLSLFGTAADSDSGVAANTVAVSLYDWQGAAVEGTRYATYSTGGWQVDYPFSLTPYGHYQLELSLADEVGNVYSETLGTIAVDDYGPVADITLPDAVISSTGTGLTGIATDVPYPQESRLFHLHLEEAAGATTFADSSGNFANATCTACPTAGQSGRHGSAVNFDGSDDTLWVEADLNPAEQPFTAMAWFYVNTLGSQQVILQQDNGSGSGRTWLYLTGSGQLASNLGGIALNSGSATASTGQWQHVALTYDGATLALYLDGVLNNSAAHTAEAADGLFSLGSNRGGSAFFDGRLDEVVIYDRALSAEEIYDLANPLDTGLASAQVRYRHLQDGVQDENAGVWYDVTLASPGDNFTTWQHSVPDTLPEGPYKIDLKATDDLGNQSYIPNAWNGEIDLFAPQLTLTYNLITPDYARVDCQAHDFSITDTNWLCPATDLLYGDEDASWFTGFFSPTTRTTYLSTSLQTVSALSNTLTACDIYGHCATTTITNAATLAEVSAILTPTTGAGFYGYDPIEISGIVRSPDDVRALDVTVNGESVYSTTWSAGLTETTWSTFWTPTTYGDYSLEATLTTGLDETIIDEGQTIITLLYPNLSLTKEVSPATLLRAGDTLTYTLTLSNSGNTATEGVIISDTLPAGISGSNFYQTVTISANQVVTYTLTGSLTGSESIITNTAYFSHSSGSGQAEVAFDRCDYIVVTNANDSGPGSLRQAIADACAGALITFADDFDIYLDSVLYIDETVTVDATDRTITVSGDSGNDGSRDVRVFQIASGSVVTLTHLNVVSGTSASGGGIYNAGTLHLLDSVVRDNRAAHISWARGGGIFNNGMLTIERSMLVANVFNDTTYKLGGAIYNNNGHTLIIKTSVISGHQAISGGGIYNYGTLVSQQNSFVANTATSGGGIYNYRGDATLANNTFADNSVTANGGGVYNDWSSTLVVNNSTFSGNAAGNAGGGLLNRMGATLYLSNTIMANSSAAEDCYASENSTMVSTVNNLFERHYMCGTPVTTANPRLSALGYYGGDTPTFALLPGSPAFDAGDDTTCETTDQRDEARFGVCDIGAFESHGFSLTYGGGSGQSTAIETAFTQPLTLTVAANVISEPVGGSVFSFSGPADGASLSETVAVAIGDDGVVSATVTANKIAGSYTVTGSLSLSQTLTYSLTNLCGVTLYTVTNAADDGAGSLRRGLNNICAGGNIIFDDDYAISLNSPLEINNAVSIDGGDQAITIDGNTSVRLFEIAADVAVQLTGLSLIDGSGILNQGDLTLTGSSLSGHIDTALQNQGSAWITNTTFSTNSSHISTTLSLTLTNSTLSGSTGDGLLNDGNLTMNNVTLADSVGDGLVNNGNLTARNSLIAGSGGADCLNSGTLAVNQNNLIEDDTCSPALSGDPLLSSLGDYGGDTSTLALLSGSPALDAGDDATCESTDQRGAARFGTCDIGAFESQGFSLSYISGGGQRTNVNTTFYGALYVRVEANVVTESIGAGEVVTYTGAVGAGGVISYTGPVSGAGLSVSKAAASTTASGLAGLAATANSTYGTYVISATTIGASEVITFELENYDCSTPFVTNGDNSGLGSLRQALLDVCDGGAITFTDDFTITLLSGLSTARQVTIDGSGHNITISGNHTDIGNTSDGVRPLTIERYGLVTLTHLSIISGSDNYSTGGGGILIESGGELHLDHVLLRGNYAYATGGGGAIYNNGTLTAKNSVFLNNTTDHHGGALHNMGTATLSNCTLSGNQSRYLGGAVYQDGGVLHFYNSSVVDNIAEFWGYPGLYGNSSELSIRNTLFANNTPDTDLSRPCAFSGVLWSSSGNNLTDYITYGCAASEVSDMVLGSPGDYDSVAWPYLPTYPLLLTSPALDAGDATTCAGNPVDGLDQRGESRLAGDGCDIGAFEAQFVLTVTGGDGQSTPGGTQFSQPLVVTLSSQNGEPVGSGGVITFSGPGLAADVPATLNGSGVASATVTAGLPVGSHVVTASGPGVITPAIFTLTNTNLAPVITPATFYVNEAATIGTGVGVAQASDANGHSLSYSITAGNTGNAFTIGASGQISVSNTLDYETTPQYLLTVAVNDGVVTETAAITINVNNRFADLVITKTVDPGSSYAGQYITYTLSFSNAGSELATGVVLTDIIPPEVTPLAIDLTADTGVTIIETSGLAYEWAISDLSPGQGGTITLFGQLTEGLGAMTLNNTAIITGTAVESDTLNNEATAALAVCGDTVTVTNGDDSGDGSLRWAIANTCPGGVITFVDDFTITLSSRLEINQALTIDGEAQAVTVSGNDAVQIFYIGGSGVVTLSHLNIINGYNNQNGGGVYVTQDGTLTVLDSSFSNNYSNSAGGAIYADVPSELSISDSDFSHNSCYDWGGAVYSEDALTVTGSNFISNTAGWSGGAISADNGGSISACLFDDNLTEAGGGAIELYGGHMYVSRTVFSRNQSEWGGAIYDDAEMTIIDSIFTGNYAPNKDGGAIYVDSDLTIMGSVFSDNYTISGDGGAIYVYKNLSLTNTTFYNNRANGGVVIVDSETRYPGKGGAIYNAGQGTVNINNSTLVSHTATFSASAFSSEEGSTVSLQNSLIAGDSSLPLCDTSLSVNNHNLIEDGSCSPMLSGDPLAASLADYGGETETIALLPGSPAINAGDDATCEATDQRGAGRVGACDIGAFESQGFGLSYGGGSPQSAKLNTAFAQPLTLTVTANVSTEPVAGGVVSFTGPDSGAGLNTAVFSPTIPANRVVSETVTANDQPGSYVVTATTTGLTGQPISFTLTNLALMADLNVTKSVTPTTALPGETITYTLILANDGEAAASGIILTDTLPVSLTVQTVISNSSAAITRTTGQNVERFELANMSVGQSAVITLTAILSDNLPANMILTNNAIITTATPDSDPANNNATIDLTIANAAPVLGTIGNQAISETVELTLTVSATDNNGDSLAFSLPDAPVGAVIDSSGLFSWTPSEADGPGAFTITVVVSDSGGLSDSRSFEVTVNEIEAAPVLNMDGLYTATETTPFSLTLTATDADLPPQSLTFGLGHDAPAGIVITTGVVSWTPSELDGGNLYTITALVTDTTGLTDSQLLTISVLKSNTAPTLAAITPWQYITETQTLTFTASATDTDTPAQVLTFTLGSLSLGSVPTGAVIDPTTGLFSWTPTESQGPGTYYAVVIVSDSAGGTDEQLVIITVWEDNTAPVLDPLSSTYTITETEILTFTVTASDTDLQPLTFALLNGPAGVSINSKSGLFVWSPTESQGPGSYSATVVVDDGALTDSQTIIITATEVNTAPVLVAISGQTVNLGETVAFTVTATDSDIPAQRLTYSLTATPSGAAIDPTGGLFSWMPASAGLYTVTVQVTDDGSPVLSDTAQVSIMVVESVLSITKTATPVLVEPGATITYTIAVGNSGNGDATGVMVQDALPDGLNGDDLDWQGTISAGQIITFTLSAIVNAGWGETIINTATYSYPLGNGGSVSATVTTVQDTTPPTFTAMSLLTPTGIINNPRPNFRWLPANDSQSGVVSYTLQITGSNPAFTLTEEISTTATVYTPTTDLPLGVYTWTVRAHDIAGNVSDWVEPPFTFTIQTNANEIYLPLIVKW